MDQQNDTLHSLAKQVADALGNEWVYQVSSERLYWATISRSDGAAVTLRFDKGRLRVSGKDPERICDPDGNDWWASGDRQTIGCAATKTPAQIARDIERRLLPKYLPLYRENLESRQRYFERRSLEKALLKRLAGAMPGATIRHGKVHLCYNGSHQPHGSLEVSLYEDVSTVKFDLTGVPIDTAMEIMQILAKGD